ncbi:hypothetical protein IF1G_10100 [Cordyceps javanica]|uniref:Uncharacterized protein n=1 Tax=Cordyceps javanica TaxID=43265 RepID=A0A545UP44_9HYPO|nr:hypothetical protein IF1G_10100 [Cordyceps javanica]
MPESCQPPYGVIFSDPMVPAMLVWWHKTSQLVGRRAPGLASDLAPLPQLALVCFPHHYPIGLIQWMISNS